MTTTIDTTLHTTLHTTIATLVDTCEQWLTPQRFKDYCPNGLQVEGVAQISMLATAVTANQAAIDAAIAAGAQALLVHHGLMWRGEDGTLTGFRAQRVRSAMAAGLNIVAYHLPLDAHPTLGNNVQLAARLGIANASPLGDDGVLYRGTIALSAAELANNMGAVLARPITLIGDANKPLRRIAWCTGGGGSYFEQAIAAGVDAFITGEASEQFVHIARESGVPLLLGGHHATERYGVQALGAALAAKLGIATQYLEVDSPL